MNQTTTEGSTMIAKIRRFTDECLDRELAFADGFDDSMPESLEWLAALRAEKQRRSA